MRAIDGGPGNCIARLRCVDPYFSGLAGGARRSLKNVRRRSERFEPGRDRGKRIVEDERANSACNRDRFPTFGSGWRRPVESMGLTIANFCVTGASDGCWTSPFDQRLVGNNFAHAAAAPSAVPSTPGALRRCAPRGWLQQSRQNHGVHCAEVRTGEHGEHRFRNLRHVNHHTVAALQRTQVPQHGAATRFTSS